MSMFKREQLIDKMGVFMTQALFYEFYNSKYEPIMTLGEVDKEYNGKTLPSLHRIYMELADPTEYDVAMHVFGSWKLWQKMCGNKKIASYIDDYRNELEIKIRSESVKSLIETAVKEGAKGTTAAKYIAEKGWDKRKAGAPTKKEKEHELKVQAGMKADIDEIWDKLDLH